MNDTTLHNRPRLWRLQFSLRLLLFAFTAFAIGFPLWYRWPYEETESNPIGPAKETVTWQRQWGGGRKKHGLQRQIWNGKTIESLVYRNGLRHGPYESTHDRGQFVDDMREGVWTAPDRTMTWHRGKLQGSAEIRLPPQQQLAPKFASKRPASNEIRKYQLVFVDGRLTHFNGKPAAGRLFDLLDDDTVDPRLRMELGKTTTIDLVEMPLKDTVIFLCDLHAIPIVLDPRVNADLPITGEYRGVDLCSALTLITAPHNVGCDYRYGCLWITTAEDCNHWHDPTGVSEIKPPAGSMLAKVWNEAVVLDAVEMPLTDALKYLEGLLAIHIDATQLKPPAARPVQKARPSALLKKPTAAVDPFSITASLRGVPFRHLLGQLLYRTKCRCRLEGENLVILPPEEIKTDPKPQ